MKVYVIELFFKCEELMLETAKATRGEAEKYVKSRKAMLGWDDILYIYEVDTDTDAVALLSETRKHDGWKR